MGRCYFTGVVRQQINQILLATRKALITKNNSANIQFMTVQIQILNVHSDRDVSTESVFSSESDNSF